MKLQVVEYGVLNLLIGVKQYRYVLLLDNRGLRWTSLLTVRLNLNHAYDLLTSELQIGTIDCNLEHYPVVGPSTDLEIKVLLDQEVPNSYLKDLYIKSRINEIEGDFK